MTVTIDGTAGITTPAQTTTGLTTATGGVVVGASAAPAFSAYQSSAQTLSNNAFTKIQFQTKEFDTASCFDATTNYRFTPTVAGYYQVNGAITLNAALGIAVISIYKNNNLFKSGGQILLSTSYATPNISTIIYLNGTTDYIELFGLQSSGSNATIYSGGSSYNYFQAFLARSA
jgi:hypothetical protein